MTILYIGISADAGEAVYDDVILDGNADRSGLDANEDEVFLLDNFVVTVKGPDAEVIAYDDDEAALDAFEQAVAQAPRYDDFTEVFKD